jgi:hypothetical protein
MSCKVRIVYRTTNNIPDRYVKVNVDGIAKRNHNVSAPNHLSVLIAIYIHMMSVYRAFNRI